MEKEPQYESGKDNTSPYRSIEKIYTSPYRSFNFQQLFCNDIFCATHNLRVTGRQSIRQSTDFLALKKKQVKYN